MKEKVKFVVVWVGCMIVAYFVILAIVPLLPISSAQQGGNLVGLVSSGCAVLAWLAAKYITRPKPTL